MKKERKDNLKLLKMKGDPKDSLIYCSNNKKRVKYQNVEKR